MLKSSLSSIHLVLYDNNIIPEQTSRVKTMIMMGEEQKKCLKTLPSQLALGNQHDSG